MDNTYSKFKEQDEYIVKIVSLSEDKNYTSKYIGKIINKTNKNLKIYLYVDKSNNLKYGDIIKLKGIFEKPSKARNDKGFDYSKYLKTQKIVGFIFADDIKVIQREENVLSQIYDIRESCINILEKLYKKEHADFLKAMLLGARNEISDETKEIFSKSNLSHVLAISGLHVTYIVYYLEYVFKRTINNIKLRNTLIIIFLLFFMFFVGASPSTIRACIMTMMLYFSKNVLKEKDYYMSFIASLGVILLINPYNIYSISMWLSFLGSLGIVLFNNFFKKLIIKKWNIRNKISKEILEIILVSVSAQILIFPIMLKNFGTFSLCFWISNLLVDKLVAPIIVLGYMSIIVFPIKNCIAFIESILVTTFLKIVLISSKIPLNRFYMIIPSNYIIYIYYAFIFALFVFYKKRKWTFLKCCLKFDFLKKVIKKNISFIKCIISLFIILIILLNISLIVPKNLRINFIDVRSRRLYIN